MHFYAVFIFIHGHIHPLELPSGLHISIHCSTTACIIISVISGMQKQTEIYIEVTLFLSQVSTSVMYLSCG
jgi:hypothetical protein